MNATDEPRPAARRRRSRWDRLAAVVTVAGLVAVVAGCGGDEGDVAGAGGTGLSGTLNGSGATFPQAFYEEAIFDFTRLHDDVTVTYAGGGSGKGRQDLADQVVDFAGSDAVVDDEDVASFEGGEFLYFPTVAAPITVAYNLEDVDELRLSADVIARIFQREITTWDDRAIAEDNPDADLPDADITVAHRSDGSGTTENFTSFLAEAAPDVWMLGSGSTVDWPTGTQGGNGNAGISQIVKSTDGAIGYIDLADARATRQKVAQVENAAGRFVEPTLEAASAAVEAAEVQPDLVYDPLNAEGEDAYPITAPTWILVYVHQPAHEVALLKAWLEFLLTDAQEWADEIDYAPLPAGMRDAALAQLQAIVAV